MELSLFRVQLEVHTFTFYGKRHDDGTAKWKKRSSEILQKKFYELFRSWSVNVNSNIKKQGEKLFDCRSGIHTPVTCQVLITSVIVLNNDYELSTEKSSSSRHIIDVNCNRELRQKYGIPMESEK